MCCCSPICDRKARSRANSWPEDPPPNPLPCPGGGNQFLIFIFSPEEPRGLKCREAHGWAAPCQLRRPTPVERGARLARKIYKNTILIVRGKEQFLSVSIAEECFELDRRRAHDCGACQPRRYIVVSPWHLPVSATNGCRSAALAKFRDTRPLNPALPLPNIKIKIKSYIPPPGHGRGLGGGSSGQNEKADALVIPQRTAEATERAKPSAHRHATANQPAPC
jgi:hypothetical protein